MVRTIFMAEGAELVFGMDQAYSIDLCFPYCQAAD